MKSLFKKGLSILAAAMMFVLCTVPVFAAEEVTSVTEMGTTHYTAQGLNNPSLTIQKYVIGAGGQADTTQPIQGVTFKYKKVGSLYQLKTTTDGEVMAYGISTEFASTLEIDDDADYTNGTNSYYKDGEVIQNAVKGKKASDLIPQDDNTFTEEETDSHGQINATLDSNPWGLYLVVETNAEGATVNKKPITVTGMQAPFIVSVPTYEGNSWKAQVIAKAKNSTGTADVEKKIVVGTDETVTDGTEKVDDTDTTSIGDTVHFRLKGEILSIPEKGQDIKEYVLTDQISKGLTPVKENKTIKIDAVRIVGGDGITGGNITKLVDGDYTVSAGTSINSSDAGVFNGGQQFTITITSEGLNKLNQVAKNTESTEPEKAIYFYYSAVVNNDAVIGPGTGNSGNPNQVKLTYTVYGSRQMETGWDKVTEYTFGLDVTKNLANATKDENNNITQVQFIVKDNASDKYLTFDGFNGTYTNKTKAANDKEGATKLSPNATDKKIVIKGLVEGTYQLEEVQTVDGYNLLASPVEFSITAEKGKNTFVGDENNQYLGTLSTSDTTGVMSMTITNTKGFRLPSTGGPGTWLLVLGGAAIIVAGFVYNHKSSKQKPE